MGGFCCINIFKEVTYIISALNLNQRYQERHRTKNVNDDMLSDNESEEDDYNNEYDDCDFRAEEECGGGGDEASQSVQIDRLYKNKLDKNKYRASEVDDLDNID